MNINDVHQWWTSLMAQVWMGVVHSLWLRSHVMSGWRLVFIVQLVQRGHKLPLWVQQLHRHLVSRICQAQRQTLKVKMLVLFSQTAPIKFWPRFCRVERRHEGKPLPVLHLCSFNSYHEFTPLTDRGFVQSDSLMDIFFIANRVQKSKKPLTSTKTGP